MWKSPLGIYISPQQSQLYALSLEQYICSYIFMTHTKHFRSAGGWQWGTEHAESRLQAANLTPTTRSLQHILLASVEKPIPPWDPERLYWASSFPLQITKVLKVLQELLGKLTKMESFKPCNHGDYSLISYPGPEILKLFPRTPCAKLAWKASISVFGYLVLIACPRHHTNSFSAPCYRGRLHLSCFLKYSLLS